MAKTDLTLLRSVLLRFHSDTGRYPTAKEGLAVLARKHAAIKGWKGPYVPTMPLDPWRHAYVYSPEGKGFSVVCYGSDGKEGGIGAAADLMVEG